jgi:tyrosinase
MPSKTTELVGEYGGSVRVAGASADARVQLDPTARNKLAASLSHRSMMGLDGPPKPPDRVYLALENITSATDAGVFHVYVNLPDSADPKDHPKNYAGVVSLIGARAASSAGGPHAGNGLAQTLEITDIVDALHLRGALDHLDIKFIPQTPMTDRDKVDVGRVRIYRQSRGP